MAAEPVPQLQPASALQLHRLDVDTYDRMVESGALEGLRIELLEGLLVEKSMISPDHDAVVTWLMRHIAMNPRWWMKVQGPIKIPEHSEPEPDILVSKRKPPRGKHLQTAEFVIEVAVSSQMVDRNVKAPLYARAGIPTYWLVDVTRRTVEVRTDPGPDGYAKCETYIEGRDRVLPCPLEGVADIDMAELFEDAVSGRPPAG